jgi:hypothetical protein
MQLSPVADFGRLGVVDEHARYLITTKHHMKALFTQNFHTLAVHGLEELLFRCLERFLKPIHAPRV